MEDGNAYMQWLERVTRLCLGVESEPITDLDEKVATQALLRVSCRLWSGLVKPSQCFGVYDGVQSPLITIESCGERIACHLDPSPAAVLGAIVYIQRLNSKEQLRLSSTNVHRLLLTAVMVASKFFDDT
jgi:hypothetical protein